MMFFSNQILEVSGSLSHKNELESALEFAMKYSGEAKNIKKKEIARGCKLLYQITEDGKYCIGWGFEDVHDGWFEYPFRFDIDIVSKIIRQHLEKFQVEEKLEGIYEKGFIMKYINEYMGSEYNEIKNPCHGIIYFKPYTCVYSK